MPDYFALGDTNKDGYMDCDEFRAISATFYIPVTKADVSMKYNENPAGSFRSQFLFWAHMELC